MEIVLRCAMTDRPGALAALAGTVGEAGGDIQSIDVLEHDGEQVLDDLVIAIDPGAMPALVDRVAAMEGVELVHTGPSRGDRSDAVSRLAIGFEALLVGSMDPDHAFTTLIGGLLRAGSAQLCSAAEAPRPGRHTLVVALEKRVLVLRRDYPFTASERQRAITVARACMRAAAAAAGGQPPLESSPPLSLG